LTDINAPDQIPSTTLAGVSIYPNGNDENAFVMVDEDGDVRAYRLSRNRLKHMFVHIGYALQE
jgi:hypothetical protein